MIIALDFDGTCVTRVFPGIGQDIGAIPILKKLILNGHKLILYTLRCDHEEDFNDFIKAGQHLQHAIEWFTKNNIPLFGIKENPNSPPYPGAIKPYCDMIIDDLSLGIPLIYPEDYDKTGLPRLSDKPFVDWKKLEALLIAKGLI